MTTTGTVNTTSSGQTYITGTVSGLDTSTLISSAVSTITARATALTDQVSTNTSKISSYQTLQTDIENLEASLNALKSTANDTAADATTSSGSGSSTSVFDSKGVSYSTSDGSDGSNYIDVTADGTATTGTHTVVVNQLAQAMEVTGSAVSSETAALGYSGSFDLSAGDGTTATEIDVTSGMSLTDVMNAINDQSSSTGVSADIMQVASGSYELVLNADSTDQAISVSNVSGTDDVLTQLGVTSDSSGDFTTVSQQAQPAEITFDGTTVTSTTNSFSNVLTGVSLDVSAAAPDTTITVDISNNTSGVTTAINNVITAYNTLFTLISAEQTVNSDGSVSSDEYLYGDSLLNGVGEALQNIISGEGNNTSSDINSLGALGITINTSNQLTISDETALTDALDNNFSDVESLFATQVTSSNSALSVVNNSSSLNSSFTLDLTTDSSGNITGASVDGEDDFTVSGDELVGNAGTAYAGLTLQYAGASSTSSGSGASTTSITVTVQQGVADRLVNMLDSYANTSTGLIQQQITQLQSTDTQLNTQAAAITAQANAYQQTLITKYADMETSISSSNVLMEEIKALLGVSSGSGSS